MDVPSHEKHNPTGSSRDFRTSSLPSIFSSTDGSMRLSHGRPSLSHYNYNLGRSFFVRRGRHHQGHQFSRRTSGSNIGILKSFHLNTISPCPDSSSLKWTGGCNSESGYHAGGRGKAFHRPERIRAANTFVIESTSSTMARIACGICLKLLRRKSPCSLENELAFDDLSVVAILVCGHVYHADCLEQQTSEVDKQDPPCPLCAEIPSMVGASIGDM